MLKFITMLTLSLFGMLAKGQEVTETRNVNGFTKIEIKNAEMIYMESDKPSLKITAEDEEVLTNVRTEIVGNTLRILNKSDYGKVTVYVGAKGVSNFTAGSGSKIIIENEIKAENVNLVLNSDAIFNGNITATGKTTIQANGQAMFKGKIGTGVFVGKFKNNARVILCGNTQTATIEASGQVTCNARNLNAGSLAINAQDDSKVWIYANDSLTIDVLEDAKVIYNGRPAKVSINPNAIAFNKMLSDHDVSYNY